jgi:enoyl-CoA hydratase/carnithine racemase
LSRSEPDLLYETFDGVARLTLNRPDRRNAMSPQMLVLLADAWQEVKRDDGIRSVILTAQGTRDFSPGGDMSSLVPILLGERAPADEWEERYVADRQEISRIAFLNPFELDKPVVAAINGDAVSGGCELMQGSDLRIASREARFGLREVERGLIPAGGSLAKLQRQIPYCRAAELVLLAERISAEEALRIGLINEIVDPDRVQARAEEVAQRLASFDPLAVQKSKQALRRTQGLSETEACRVQQECYDEFILERG